MNRMLALIGSTAGGYLGWWLGAHVGTMTAFMLSIVCMGIGLWAARRLAVHYGM